MSWEQARDAVRAALKGRALRQADLARMANLSQRTIGKMLKGEEVSDHSLRLISLAFWGTPNVLDNIVVEDMPVEEAVWNSKAAIAAAQAPVRSTEGARPSDDGGDTVSTAELLRRVQRLEELVAELMTPGGAPGGRVPRRPRK